MKQWRQGKTCWQPGKAGDGGRDHKIKGGENDDKVNVEQVSGEFVRTCKKADKK